MENKVLKDYVHFLLKLVKSVNHSGSRWWKIARHYISHARSSADESTLDELGIETSRLNAKLLIYALKQKAYPHPPDSSEYVTP